MIVLDNWTIIPISELEHYVTSGSRGWAQFYSDNGELFIRITNLTREKLTLDLTDAKYVALPPHNSEGKRTRIQKGDILVSITADLGITSYIEEIDCEAYINQHIALVRLNDQRVYNKFAAYQMASNAGYQQLIRLNDAGAKSGLNLNSIRRFQFYLPPLPEQRKIAEILGTWDEAITLTERLIAARQRRKKALMQQLLTGRRRFGEFVRKVSYRTAFNIEVPIQWKVFEFGEFVTKSEKKFDPQKTNISVPCVELEHISQETGRILGHVSSVEQNSIKNRFRAGQVLFGKLRPYLRKYAQPQFDGACSSEIWVLSSKGKLCDNDFLFYLVQSDRFLNAANVTSGTKMPRSDWNYISEFAFAIPPIEEQRKIAVVLQACDEEIELLGQKLAAFKRQKKGLMQQLLTGQVRVRVER